MSEYEYEDHSVGYKLLIAFIAVLLFGLALVLVGFVGNFFYTYKTVIFYIFAVVFSSVMVFGLYWLNEAVKVWFERKHFENRHYEQQLLSIASNNELSNATVRQLDSGQVFLVEQRTEQGVVKFRNFPKAVQKQSPQLNESESPLALTSSEIKNSLLSDLEHCQRMLVSGGSGTGKTSLLLHIAEQRDQLGDLVILDLDGKLNKWGNYKAHGAGDNPEEIVKELERLKAVFKQRSNDYANDIVQERGFPLITIIADEWHEMSAVIPDLADRTKKILTRGRKFSMDLIVGSNGSTAKSLGLDGQMDLVHNFEARVRLDKVVNQRLAYVTFGKGKEEVVYEHCGPFIQTKNHQPVAKEIKLAVDFSNKLNEILSEDLVFDLKVIDAFYELKNAGNFSWNNLSKAVYDGKVNGRYVANLKAVLARHKIEVSQ